MKKVSDDLSSIKESLNANPDRIVKHLLPNAKKKGHEYEVGSINGEAGSSLKIEVNGEGRGKWKEFNGGPSGDLIDLWCAVRRISIAEALSEIKGYLGIGNIEITPVRKKQWLRPQIEKGPDACFSKVYEYLMKERLLTKETLSTFRISARIKDHKDVKDKNAIVFPYYRGQELIFAKNLWLERDKNGKKAMLTEKDCQPILFGWQAVPRDAKNLIITEGEIDAMTLHQYLPEYAVLSIPLGGGTGHTNDWIGHEYENLDYFDCIYLCLDQDMAGKLAASDISSRLGAHRCKLVSLPYKDANECLKNGVEADVIEQCLMEAKCLAPKELVPAEYFIEEVHRSFEEAGKFVEGTYGLPWSKVGNRIQFRPNELSVWGGYNGHGKSQVLSHILCHQVNERAKICLLSIEMTPKNFLNRMVKQITALENPTRENRNSAFNYLAGSLWIYNIMGTIDPDRMLEIFTYAHKAHGADVFLIDSFLRCGISEEDYPTQKAFIEKLCDFKNKFPIHVHIIAHLRKGDEDICPGKMSIRGTGAISDLADNCFEMWRNRPKEKEAQKENYNPQKKNEPDCILQCDKNRHGEWEGAIDLWFDKSCHQYLERIDQKPASMITL